MVDGTPAKENRPDRTGMKSMVIFLPPEVARQVKIIAAATDRTVQQIGVEMVSEWFERHEYHKDKAQQEEFKSALKRSASRSDGAEAAKFRPKPEVDPRGVTIVREKGDPTY